MRVLVIGGGGREHALAWKIAASPLVAKVFAAPGNPGTACVAENVAISAMDVQGLVRFARAEAIDLVVPGPEGPLVAGIADAMQAAGIRCFGPSQAAARLEGSKSFAKDICAAADIPTARWEGFTDLDEALAFARLRGAPLVVKADGLAGGKGVVMCRTEEEAEAALRAMLLDGAFGEAGRRVLVEEWLEGEECSLFALCDGQDAVLLGAAQDHKRLHDGDTGPNTGGMGAITPVPHFDPEPAMDSIIRPALAELAGRGAPFRGVLFAGLMLTESGAKLIEFNVRFGDPECQVLLPRLRTDLVPAMVAACDGELTHTTLMHRADAVCGVVLAAPGYPDAPEKGSVIGGLENVAKVPGALLFHAGTRCQDAQVVADGGRVLTVVGMNADPVVARATAYAAIELLDWPKGSYRTEIGLRALR